MTYDRNCHGLLIAAFLVMAMAPVQASRAADVDLPGQIRRAIAYLDSRQEDWARFGSAKRGTADDRTTCLSCHTGISFALTRPSLGRFVGEPKPSASEERTIVEVIRRVEHWAELDSPRFRLMYDHDERKKIESRGTEAVLDSLILARRDFLLGRPDSAPASRMALGRLWETQQTAGSDAGSWDWLNFGLQPWEGESSQAFGASLAAIAAGSAPGYLDGPLDERATQGVTLLRDYLRRRFPSENLHNRLWILEASTIFKNLLSTDQIREVLEQLRTTRRDDGGWALASFGPFRRVDGSTQSDVSEGYSTGLAVHALIVAGASADRLELEQGVAWLRSHQRLDGSWPGISVNKERDPATFTGKLMIDAATGFAARALVEAESR